MTSISAIVSRLAYLRQRAGLRAVLSNSGWMMGEQILRLAIGIGVGIWIARLLGPAEFGALSYAIAFATVFGIVATLGLNRILVRELASKKDELQAIDTIMSTAFSMRMLAATLMYAICLGVAWLSDDHHLLLVGIIAGSFFFSASDCVELYFQSRVEARVTARARMLSLIVVTAVRVKLLYMGASVTAFALVTLLEYAGAAWVLQFTFRANGKQFKRNMVDWRLARRMLTESWPEIIAGFSGLLFVRLDQIMLQHLVGARAVGVFAVAARLSEAWYFIPTAIVASTFPSIVATREADTKQYMRRLQYLMLLLCVLSYCAALTASALSRPIIHVLYGNAYDEAAPILAILIWSGLFVSLGLASGSWIMAERKVRLNLYRNLAGLASNFALNFLLIPLYGALGAACATLLSLVVAYMLFDTFIPSMREISRHKWRAILVFPSLVKR